MTTTATVIVKGALQLLGVIDAEATPTPVMFREGLRRLNLMVRNWGLQPLTVPTVAREVFSLDAGKGGPGNPYTIGDGGDFDTTRPSALAGVGLLMPATPVDVEISRALYTDDGYEAIPIKDLPNSMFTGAYFNPTFADGFATINLWPVPTVTTYSIVLYRPTPIGVFPTLAASVDVPDGSEEPIEYNLAIRLSALYSVPLQTLQDVQAIARTSLAVYKRANVKVTDLPCDPLFVSDPRGGYNIQTGQ